MVDTRTSRPTSGRSAMLPAAVLVACCATHNHGAGGTRDRHEPIRDDPAETATATPPPAERAEPPPSDCAVPGALPRMGDGLALPSIAASDEVEVERADTMIELARTGDVLVRFEIRLASRAPGDEVVLAGFSYRLPDVGRSFPEPIAGLVLESGSATLRSCRVAGPPEMQRPFVDVARWIEIDLPAGGRATVSGMYKAEVPRTDKPATLFGYRDRFALNWKNWDWPYTKAPEYRPIAERLRPFHGELALIPAAPARVTLRCRDGEDWLRTMSHEQDVRKLRSPGTYEWVFEQRPGPSRLGFEYMPGLPIAEEISVFEAIVASRRDDLRARIRLSDLLRFGGDPSRRAAVLSELLEIWPAHAGRQLLEGRNDVRAGAWVGLVKALGAAGRDAEARRAAKRGVAALEGLASGDDGERESLALSWLSAASRGEP